MNPDPELFIPTTPGEFIGPAKRIALMLEARAERLLATKKPAPAKILLFGNPGVAKTRLVEMFGKMLAWHPTDIESTNGRNLTIDVVRRWQESDRYLAIGGRWTVRIVNELDTAPIASQDLLLSALDTMPGQTAFLGTSNLQLMMLSERFETRLQQFRVDAPTTEEIAKFLRERWRFTEEKATEIATGAKGNCRCALLDAQSVLDVQRIAA